MEQQAGQARFLYQRVPCSPQVAYRFATPLRDIEGQWDISRSALDRHKGHDRISILNCSGMRFTLTRTPGISLRVKRTLNGQVCRLNYSA